MASDYPVVCSISTGCLEVFSTIFPYTAWRVPLFHSLFENSAATIAGIETAYRALKKKGKVSKEVKFIGWGGDGGTYDIGFQALSGAAERGHDMLFICYDNQAYMNTGVQRSSATPFCAHTTTSPAGTVIPGKIEPRKDLTEIMVAHGIPYAAQAIPSRWRDLMTKVQKALNTEGPKFMNILAPCVIGWGYAPNQTLELCKLAVETRFWPLYEVENGEYRLNYKPKENRPIEDWLKPQGRFRHLFRPENANLRKRIQELVDERWSKLLLKCGEKA
jgi:pyruvate ferredoxin oxidoreductase beta subunit